MIPSRKKRIRIILLLLIGINLPNLLIGQDDYFLIWDKQSSSIANAENLLSIHRVIYDFENKNIKPSYWKEDNWKGKSLGISFRLTKTILLDFLIDNFFRIHQHEVFGHGYRFREFELEGNSYNVRLAPPYGKGGGFARRGSASYNRKFGIHENIATSMGGLEASTILTNSLRNKWLARGTINYRETLLFVPPYFAILQVKFIKGISPTNDVSNYLKRVNSSYGFFTEDSYELTLNDLSHRFLVSALNPYPFYALFTYFRYLINGKENFEIPMIKLGKAKWLPAIRFGLTPFGSELILENHFIQENNILEISYRHGDNILDNFWGGGIKFKKKINDQLILQSIIDFWNQPEMTLGGIKTFNTTEGLGGRIAGELNYQFGQETPIGIYALLGYKTSGFIEGEKLNKGLILRLGMSLKI